jgi:hypothetical protein
LTNLRADGEDARIATTSSHAAPGQAAGYEYQRQLSLVLLAEALYEDPRVAVRLEAVEDIDVVSEDDSVSRNVQAKHHLDDYTLTDRAPELWRTLRVWMDLEKGLRDAALPNLQLATTSKAAADAAVSLLGPNPEDREVTVALSKLLVVAREHGAEDTREIRKRFAGLPESSQLKLLHAATILDASEPVMELNDRLRVALGMVVPREQPDAFLERVKGWWVDRSVELLARERDQITGQQLYEYCDAVRDEYRRGTLAITRELRDDPDTDAKKPLLSKPFIRQLSLVGAPGDVKDLAVRHYYRAYAQRGRWAREIDDLDEDIQGYEQTLTDEWETEFVALTVRVSTEAPDRAREGLKFAMGFGSYTRAQLRGVDEHVLCRGTLHGLADRLAIGWHPDYRELMVSDE